MDPRRLALVALPLLAVPLPAQDLAWPEFRGPRRDGVARGAKPPLEWSDEHNLAWRVELPGPGSSSPIVVGDRVYVTCYTGYGVGDEPGDPEDLEHHLVCVARDTGAVLWDTVVPGPLPGEARQVQLNEHGFASPTPVSDGDTVYAYLGKAGVAAFDRDGGIRWRTDLGTPAEDGPVATNRVMRDGRPLSLRWGAAASPLLWRGLVIVNASEESDSIRALDARTGEVVWKRESPNLEGSACSPMLAGAPGAPVLVIVLGGEVWGLAPDTGELLWRVETGTRGGMVPMPLAGDRLVYAFGGEGESHAIRFARDPDAAAEGDGRVVWRSLNVGIPSPVLHDGVLFLVNTRGIAILLDAEDGEAVSRGRLEGRTGSIYASPVLADGRLYVVSRERGTFVYSADEKLELLARNRFAADDSRFNASPALAGTQLFLRSDRYLYRVDGGRGAR